MTATSDTIATCDTHGRTGVLGAAALGEALGRAARTVMDSRGRLPSPGAARHLRAAGVGAC